MTRAAEMRSLTEHLARSYEERMAGLAARQAEVKSTLQVTRQWMVERHSTRAEAATAFHHDLAHNRSARSEAVAGALSDFARDRAEMAAAQAQTLAKATSERCAEVEALRASAQSAMREIQFTRAAGAAALKEELRQGRADMFRAVSDLMNGIHHARAVMAATQCETLEAGRAALKADVSAAVGEYHAAREALAGNLMEFKQVWQEFANAKQSHPSGVAQSPPPPKAEAEPTPKPQVVKAPVAREAPVDFQSIPPDEAVFSYLADHPDGVRLVELEAHFGTPRIRLVPIITRLIEENKARKDDEHKLYFAT